MIKSSFLSAIFDNVVLNEWILSTADALYCIYICLVMLTLLIRKKQAKHEQEE